MNSRINNFNLNGMKMDKIKSLQPAKRGRPKAQKNKVNFINFSKRKRRNQDVQ
jgi:hypothetical protein